MNTIISNDTTDKQFNFTINRFFKDNKIGYILKQCNFSKERGFSCIKIFQYIFMLVFTGKTYLETWSLEKTINFQKILYIDSLILQTSIGESFCFYFLHQS